MWKPVATSFVVLADIFRPARRTALADIVDMAFRWLGIPAATGAAVLLQDQIPGVRHLYPWAFPVITGIVGFALITFYVAVGYRLKLERPKLFDVVCPTVSIGLPLNQLDDGTFTAPQASLGFHPILVAHRGELTNVVRLTATPQVRFIRSDGWATTNSIQVQPGQNPLAGPGALDYQWDNTNPQQWVLTGLPVTMAKDELLTLPLMALAIIDAQEAGTHFTNGETCSLVVRLAVRTDKGAPPLPDQVIAITRSDIKDTEWFKTLTQQASEESPD